MWNKSLVWNAFLQTNTILYTALEQRRQQNYVRANRLDENNVRKEQSTRNLLFASSTSPETLPNIHTHEGTPKTLGSLVVTRWGVHRTRLLRFPRYKKIWKYDKVKRHLASSHTLKVVAFGYVYRPAHTPLIVTKQRDIHACGATVSP